MFLNSFSIKLFIR